MKIGIFGTRMDLISGHSRPAFELAQQLQERGHDVRVVTSQLSPLRQQYHDSMNSNSDISVERVFTSYRDLYRARQVLQDFIDECDVIHEFSPYGLGLLPGLSYRKVPSAISIVNSLHAPLRDSLKQGIRFSGYGLQPRFLPNLIFPRCIMRSILDRAGTIITWSVYTYNQAAHLGIPERKLLHIPIGIDHARFRPDMSAGKPGQPTFLYSGPVTPIHGVDLLVKAFTRFLRDQPASHLIIADRGPDLAADTKRHQNFKDYCMRLTEPAQREGHITWQGFISDMSTLFNSADVVILPFRVALGYAQPSMTLIEALGHGKPVISTACGAVPEIITSEENGYVVEPGDAGALYEAMHRVVSRPLTLSSEQIRMQIMTRHAWPAIVDAHEYAYEQLIQANQA